MIQEHPILFSADMVRVILAGKKNQTRRVIKIKFTPEPARIIPYSIRLPQRTFASQSNSGKMFINSSWQPFKCRYGIAGDHLWVKEAYSFVQGDGKNGDFGVKYGADGKIVWWMDHAGRMSYPINTKNRSSRFMPHWTSRISLENVKVHAEHLQDITRSDIEAEGFDSPDEFIGYWNRLNGKAGYGWHKDPWVFVITFKRIK